MAMPRRTNTTTVHINGIKHASLEVYKGIFCLGKKGDNPLQENCIILVNNTLDEGYGSHRNCLFSSCNIMELM